jgi:general stress protein 26
MSTATFEAIEAEFLRRVARTVWCSVATVDARNRVRTRILHPLWEGSTGWILTARQSAKAKDLAHNPMVSCAYWDQDQEQVHADCRTTWEESLAEKRRLWDLFKSTPPPVGYDPGLFFPGGPEDPAFGLLKLAPWRIELWSLNDLMTGKPPTVWRR